MVHIIYLPEQYIFPLETVEIEATCCGWRHAQIVAANLALCFLGVGGVWE